MVAIRSTCARIASKSLHICSDAMRVRTHLNSMSEPKYCLNKRDRARWRELALKEAKDTLTLVDDVELRKLEAKQTRRRNRHPAMRRYLRRQRYLLRKTDKLAKELSRLLAQYCK